MPIHAARALGLAERYFHQEAPSAGSRGGRLARLAHSILLEACFDAPEQQWNAPTVRRSSITEDGTPLIYSLKTDDHWAAREFRCVGEPGGYSIDTDLQALRAIDCASDMCRALGWAEAASKVATLAADLLPPDLTSTRGWWGGAWVGLDACPDSARIKVYVNLRPHESETAWCMIDDAFARFGGRVTARVRDAVNAAEGHPAGACIAIEGGRFAGLRLYLGFDRPDQNSIATLAGRLVHAAGPPSLQYCRQFCERFGAFEKQSVAVALDFAIDRSTGIREQPVRVKAELCAELLPPDERLQVADWFVANLGSLGLSPRPIQRALNRINQSFGGVLAKYVSLGVTLSGARHATLYLHPFGMQVQHGLIAEGAS